MRWHALLLCSGLASATLNLQQIRPPRILPRGDTLEDKSDINKRQAAPPRFLNNGTQRFAVNGTGLPDVDFDVGESYSGLLPMSTDPNDPNQLFFWFFPSENQTVGNEITIWLTGGPGCSSTGELMSENGPMLWQPGVFRPIQNKWSWHRLTNMVWIDQPIGSGFSQGTVTAQNEFDVARQFMGFWKNFVDTFAMQGYKVYITGSSYSGMYCPYIASEMLNANDTNYFDVKGMQVFDGLYSNNPTTQDIPASSFATTWSDVFGFNDSFTTSMQARSKQCGYDDYLQQHLVYPPSGQQPSTLPGVEADQTTILNNCSIFNDVYSAAVEVNPCFSLYTITQLCPMKYDPLGFSDGTMYVPAGSGPVYFDRQDVKTAIHAPPNTTWEFCTSNDVFVNGTDTSVVDGPGSQPVIPNVVERTQNVILGHGSQDFVLISDGTLLSIQNMTWGGMMGFQSRPTAPLYVPYHANDNFETVAGAGVAGTVHSERGLTYFAVGQSGHFLTENQPAVAFRSLEILLGRVEGFQSMAPFTTDVNKTSQPQVDMGNGTVLIVDGGVVDRGTSQGQDGTNRETSMLATTSAAGRTICGMSFMVAVMAAGRLSLAAI